LDFSLEQNNPNPFNPATRINYTLPVQSRITLKIYNILGQVVKVLLDGEQDAGYRSVEWNAQNVASGIYFCRLDASGSQDPGRRFEKVNKMILMK